MLQEKVKRTYEKKGETCHRRNKRKIKQKEEVKKERRYQEVHLVMRLTTTSESYATRTIATATGVI